MNTPATTTALLDIYATPAYMSMVQFLVQLIEMCDKVLEHERNAASTLDRLLPGWTATEPHKREGLSAHKIALFDVECEDDLPDAWGAVERDCVARAYTFELRAQAARVLQASRSVAPAA